MITVPIDHLYINPHQPRQNFCQNELQELSESIKSVGVLHPPLVRRTNENRYELISGERRWRAAKLAGLTEITVVLREKTEDGFSAKAALIENVQRSDLNPIEIARALYALIHAHGLTQEGLAQQVGKPRSTIANYLRLLSMPEKFQSSLLNSEMTMGHAKAILSLTDPVKQLELHQLIVKEGFSVRQAERWVCQNENKNKKNVQGQAVDPHVADLQAQMQLKLGTKVQIHNKGSVGSISIDYYSLDDLDRILAIIGIKVHVQEV